MNDHTEAPLFHCERCGIAVYTGGNYPPLCDLCLSSIQQEEAEEQDRRAQWDEEHRW
jgi:hypothetical protein